MVPLDDVKKDANISDMYGAARKLQKYDGCTAISDHDVTCDAVSWFKIWKGDRRTVCVYDTNCVRLH